MNPIERKILENDYVRLVPLMEEHQWQVRDAVMQTSSQLWKYMVKDAFADFDGWFSILLDTHKAGKQNAFVIFDKANNKAVGCSSIMAVEQDHGRLEIGNTWYVPAAQGTSVNPASKLSLMSYAFEEAGCNRLELKCDSLNERSQRAILKVGAIREGTLRQHMVVHDGKGGTRSRDTVYFSILHSEWPEVKIGLQKRLAEIERKPPMYLEPGETKSART